MVKPHRKLLNFLGEHQWAIVFAMWTIAVILGFWGFSRYFAGVGVSRSVLYRMYVTLQLFTVESGAVSGEHVYWQLQIARLLAPLTTLSTAIAAFAAIFREQLQSLRLRFLEGHTVICGLGRKGFLLAKAFRERGATVVVLEKDTHNDRIEQCRELGATVILGDVMEDDLMIEARIRFAENLISVCGEDGVNAEVAEDARTMVRGRAGAPLRCVAEINDVELAHLLREHEQVLGLEESFRLEFFNSYIRGAKALLARYPAFDAADRDAHILVVGMGRLGQELVVHGARTWYNRRGKTAGKMRFTLIDRDPEDRKRLLLLRNPFLKDVCEFTAIPMDAGSSEFYEGRFLFDDDGQCKTTRVYVCLDNDSRALAASLALLKHLRGRDIPIVTRMAHEAGLGTLIREVDSQKGGFGQLRAFGFIDSTCDPDLVLGGSNEILARSIHEELIEHAGMRKGTSLPESSTRPWKDLPDELRDAFRGFADHLRLALLDSAYVIEPLRDLNTETFAFTADEVRSIARRLYELTFEAHARGKPGSSFMYDVTRLDSQKRKLSWDRAGEAVQRPFIELVEQLPPFLTKFDFGLNHLD